MDTRTWVIAGMMLALTGSPLQAATEAERLLKQDIDRREQERRDRRWDESHVPGASEPAPVIAAPGEIPPGPCFPVRTIQLSPDDILAPQRVHALLASYRGRCLQASDLVALQEALNAEALAEGLVTTRVVVPEQNLASGELLLKVWPGRVEALRAQSLRPWELALATPQRVGELLQLRALEQTVDNLNRLASFQASVELLPGQQPGGSIVDFSVVHAAPWQAGLSWQSDALNGAASNTLRASLTLDSPLNLADRLILGLNANLQDGQVDDAHGGSVDYDLPVGWWRFSVGADRFDYQNPITAGLTTFMASGESRSWRAELSRTVHRNARRRWSLALHGKQRLSDNLIDDVTIGVSTTRIKALGLRSDFSRVSAPWVFDATLDAESGDARSPAEFSPVDSHYSRLLASSRLQYHFPRGSVSGSVNGQWSDARLAASEQFTLTAQVPGFTPLSLNAATGVSAQVEAAFPLFLQRAGFTTLRPTLGAAWALAPHGGGNFSREQVAALKTGMTAPWKNAVMNAGISFPLQKLSSIDALDSWQLDASFSLQW